MALQLFHSWRHCREHGTTVVKNARIVGLVPKWRREKREEVRLQDVLELMWMLGKFGWST